MECQHCKSVLKEGETYNLNGKLLCEDCYIYETNPPRACDPMAVSSALSIRKQLGQSESMGLSELQKKIYCVIDEHGKITKDELIKIAKIKPEELEQEFAFFRHCELVRAFREDGKVFLTKWQVEK